LTSAAAISRAAALAAGLAFLPQTALASIDWIRGTGSASAHDKQLAHDLAYEAAIRDADKRCTGAHGAISELKSSSTYSQATDEWRFEVTIRLLCIGMEGGGM